MRLNQFERDAIVSAVRAFDDKATTYLFGSRTQDELAGGDIDLLVASTCISFTDRVTILINIKTKLGEQKIDLKVVKSLDDPTDSFVQMIRSQLNLIS